MNIRYKIQLEITLLTLLFLTLSIISMYMLGSAYLRDSRPLLQRLVTVERVGQLNQTTSGAFIVIKNTFHVITYYDGLLEKAIENRIIKIRFSVIQLFS